MEGLDNPKTIFIIVDFPAPLGPNIPVKPGLISTEISEIPCTSP